MTPKPNTLASLAKQAAFLVLLSAGAFLVLDFALDASEKEDCGRWRGQAAQGYPVTVPAWCEGK
jgi:hypothetical protein